MKKVSVITPVYNVEKYIAATVQSVLDQTYQSFEYLLIDDGSPDQSVEICQQFLDPRIKIIRQENQGANAARNEGIRQAQGEYLAFLDGDDLWLPEKLEKHIEHLENNPNLGISFSCSGFIDEAGNSLGIYQLPKLKDITMGDIICRNPISNGSCAVFRKEVFEAIKYQETIDGKTKDLYWDEGLQGSQDLDCWFRIAIQTNWHLEGIPDSLTLYRVNSGGISANLFKKQRSWEQVIEKTRSYAPEVVVEWENRARAYHSRYLARRAVTLRDGAMAVQFFNEALGSYWQMLWEEPRRTVLTGAAAYLLWLIPENLYKHIEALALKTTGSSQKRRISQAIRGT
ncbi:MAG: glycosyltransferase family 2 protein [Moorea sp. SIO3I7]|uniref:Glucosyl transferase n=1 Tax=Moorena bouillonii PNG TaxID=568701 RepID=A0A1U7NAM6_9CYAN|nr:MULTISPECIES: glycosyltransferase family 2 protein [Moorena]NEO00575.1 glycosyltransferase family 2 protein [Moorena sp. SIO3I7]NEO51373.1 glycosyltransferase family 2 protein [Moorena sp. SIO4A3]NEO13556.1 glycosyltransferase family 2 protein [Moorena sp. SIO3E8]NEP27387.1 glycosyltransferase family 2 protein [Moorena sp. SIO3I6]NEP99978.1 glycosyltransferase family 2 protein [Moorena sp. SIO3F7]